MKVIVLAGGISTEREVSIVSGFMICKALRARGHEAVLMDVFCGNRYTNNCDIKLNNIEAKITQLFPDNYNVDDEVAYIRSFNDKIQKIKRKSFFGYNVLESCNLADVVFMALHGDSGENGKVQAVFELLGIKFTGCGMLGSALAMDKELSRQLFMINGIPIPPGMSLKINDERKPAKENEIGLPCVVKPCCGGSSVGVMIAHTEEEYSIALKNAFKYEERIIVEKYIKGREFSVGIVNGQVYPVIEIEPVEGFYNYHNKYHKGATLETCPAELSKEKTLEIQNYTKIAYEALRINCYARIDFLMSEKGEIFCLEANTLPGMTPTSLIPKEAKVLGMEYEDFCEYLLYLL